MNGALGPLFNATVDIAGVPVSALVDPGLSAIIMSIQDNQNQGSNSTRSSAEAEVTLWDYTAEGLSQHSLIIW